MQMWPLSPVLATVRFAPEIENSTAKNCGVANCIDKGHSGQHGWNQESGCFAKEDEEQFCHEQETKKEQQ